MVWLIVLIFITKRIKNKTLKSYFLALKSLVKANPSLFVAIALFLSGATISIFTSINLKSALGEWKAFYIEPFLIFIILITTLNYTPPPTRGRLGGGQGLDKKNYINNILSALVLCGLATALLAIYQHFTGWMVPWEYWENRNTYRVTVWYGFPNGVGLFLAPLIPLALYLLKQSLGKLKIKNKRYEIGDRYTKIQIISYLLSLISIPLATLFAKSTGGLIGIIAGIIFLLVLWKKTQKFTLVFGILTFTAFIFMPNNQIKEELLLQDRSGQIRIAMWGETVEFLSDNPIRGAGLASYKTLIYPYRIDKWIEVFHHPHNIFLTMWVNLGLLGLVGFVWILVWFFRAGFLAIGKKIPPLGEEGEGGVHGLLIVFLLSSMVTLITTGLVDSPYIKNDLSLFFWLLIALMIISTRQNPTKELK